LTGGLRLVRGAPQALEDGLAAAIGDARSQGDPLALIGVLIGGTLVRPYLQRHLRHAGPAPR
jgi:hypothetical protein